MPENDSNLTLELFKKEWYFVPNLMTELRGILSPVIFLFLVCHVNWLVTITVYVAAALTDLIDGRWARKHKQETRLGKNLDPIVDKLLAGFVLLGLCIVNPVAWLVASAVIIATREIAVAIVVELSRRHGNPLSVTWWGKVKTVFHGVAFFLTMLPIAGGVWLIFVQLVWLSAVFLTITSGIGYIKRAYETGVL